MAYHQAHLLLLAGYSSFFVSGLVLPQPPFESDNNNDVDCDMTVDEEMDYSEDEPIAVDELCPRFAAAAEDEQEHSIIPANAAPGATSSEHRGRKRFSSVSELHAHTMSRWLLDSAISLGDRQRHLDDHYSPTVSHQSFANPNSEPELTTGFKQKQQHQAKRPRLSRFQTSPSYMQPRLSVG